MTQIQNLQLIRMCLKIWRFYLHFSSPPRSPPHFVVLMEELGQSFRSSPGQGLLSVVISFDFLSFALPVNYYPDLEAWGDLDFVSLFANSFTGDGVCPAIRGSSCLLASCFARRFLPGGSLWGPLFPPFRILIWAASPRRNFFCNC